MLIQKKGREKRIERLVKTVRRQGIDDRGDVHHFTCDVDIIAHCDCTYDEQGRSIRIDVWYSESMYRMPDPRLDVRMNARSVDATAFVAELFESFVALVDRHVQNDDRDPAEVWHEYDLATRQPEEEDVGVDRF